MIRFTVKPKLSMRSKKKLNLPTKSSEMYAFIFHHTRENFYAIGEKLNTGTLILKRKLKRLKKPLAIPNKLTWWITSPHEVTGLKTPIIRIRNLLPLKVAHFLDNKHNSIWSRTKNL